MSNSDKMGAIIVMAVILTVISLVIFHFWLFPTGITVLEGFDGVNVTQEFSNALYWFVVGIFVFTLFRSIKVTF